MQCIALQLKHMPIQFSLPEFHLIWHYLCLEIVSKMRDQDQLAPVSQTNGNLRVQGLPPRKGHITAGKREAPDTARSAISDKGNSRSPTRSHNPSGKGEIFGPGSPQVFHLPFFLLFFLLSFHAISLLDYCISSSYLLWIILQMPLSTI